MLFTTKNVFAAAAAFASIASAAPTIEARSAVSVSTDTGLVAIIPAVSAAKRQVTLSADAAVLAIIDKVTGLVQGMVDSDTNRRKYFTQQVVGSAEIDFPGKNIVMANVGYGFTGKTITVQRAIYDAKVGSDVTFDVLVFDAGNTFTLKGDGGFQNWAYSIQSTCKVSGGGAILQC